MIISYDETLFGPLWKFIENDEITDIKWNGRQLWIDEITKGRYLSDVVLTDDFLRVFTNKIATSVNVNFNPSNSSLQAETDELRIHAIHPFRTGDGTYILAIRKTPAVARLNNEMMLETGYADRLALELLGAMVRSEMSGFIIGDVGAGKTELIKYMASFIPGNHSALTVEDTLEMKLPVLYPDKDISSVKTDEYYPTEQAIRDALRCLVKYLIIAEARGREIARIIEGASTGCIAWTSIHAGNVWEVPDRVVNMAGKEEVGTSFENDVYTFFDVAIKVKKTIEHSCIRRSIDQICFFSREDGKNRITIFMKDGKYTGSPLPKSIQEMMKNEQAVLKYISQHIGGGS